MPKDDGKLLGFEVEVSFRPGEDGEVDGKRGFARSTWLTNARCGNARWSERGWLWKSSARRVETGKLKAPEKIGEAAGRILARNHGHRYYGWELEKAVFRFFEHPVHFAREKAYEGKYGGRNRSSKSPSS